MQRLEGGLHPDEGQRDGEPEVEPEVEVDELRQQVAHEEDELPQPMSASRSAVGTT